MILLILTITHTRIHDFYPHPQPTTCTHDPRPTTMSQTPQKRACGTVLNHISSLSHVHQLAGYELSWSSYYHFQLLLRGVKRSLGKVVSRKSAITPSILNTAVDIFNFSIPLHAALWALFLVASFSFLRKSNLVPDNPRQISPKLITQANLVFTWGLIYMFLIRRPSSISNVLWFCSFQRSRSCLCPIAALRRYLSLNAGAVSAPLFTVSSSLGFESITYKQFCAFLSWAVPSMLNLDPSLFSPHNFRRGGRLLQIVTSPPK